MDPRDIYFVEHRMTAWASALACESDSAFDTVIPFASHEMLDLARSVSKADRMANRLIDAICEIAHPGVLSVPRNPELEAIAR